MATASTMMQETSYSNAAFDDQGDETRILLQKNDSAATPTLYSSFSQKDKSWKVPIETYTSKKQGEKIKHIKRKKVRKFYQAQDDLIEQYEEIRGMPSKYDLEDQVQMSELTACQSKKALRWSQITLFINLILMSAKLAASILSGSMSIISSLIDSVVDLLSGIIMWWATRAMRQRNIYLYPQGRTKLEPVAIIILSTVMSMASIVFIRESVTKLVTLLDDPNALPVMDIPTLVIAGSTVVTKFILWVICRRVPIPTVQALALDHRNDVCSNTVAIVCGYLGSIQFQDQFDLQGFIYVDPAGAILISLYIIVNWCQLGAEQIKLLTGRTATPEFISKITWMTLDHDKRIKQIDTVRAFHSGNNFLVEVDIVLPETMNLREAHDIGERLQQKLETLPEVERAFVHLDYEFTHDPKLEHKVP